MSDEQTQAQKEPSQAGSADPWQDIGRQFQTLGESLADIFRTAWNKEENRPRVEEMKTGLEAMAKEVNQAIKETAASPQVQEIRTEAVKAAETFREAGEKTVQEVRPQILEALRQVNQELQKVIGSLQGKPAEEKKDRQSSG